MLIDTFYQGRLPGEKWGWVNAEPRHVWIMALGFVLVIDWRPRHPPEPGVFDGTCFAPKKPRGELI